MNTITCKELNEKLASKEEFILLDVRNQDEWDEGHIEGAILLPLHILPLKYTEVLLDKDQLVVTCCRSGGRSGQALQFLESQGYINVYSLEGGYNEYCEQIGDK